MSVDTYLKRKRTDHYQMMRQGDVRFLVAPVLARNAKRLHVGLKRTLFWKSWSVQIEPLKDHFHGPSCRH